MKNDQYIPHEVSMRSSSQVINLIEAEGAAGYGFYWAVLEYLRAQNHYTGDIRAIKNIARQMKVRIDKAIRILNDYDLFIVENTAFFSPFLNEKMLPLERKRAKLCSEKVESVSENVGKLSEMPCNSLETSDGSFKNKKKNKNKKNKNKKEEMTTSSSKEAAAVVEPWERHIDSLRHEEQWKEIMAMQSGMGKDFIRRFDDVLQHFKQHVRAVANESHIVSPSEARKYFCFYLTPGGAPYQKLMLHLQQTETKDLYRFEQRNPATGERSYCGVPIPEDAPPRPNNQACGVRKKGNGFSKNGIPTPSPSSRVLPLKQRGWREATGELEHCFCSSLPTFFKNATAFESKHDRV